MPFDMKAYKKEYRAKHRAKLTVQRQEQRDRERGKWPDELIESMLKAGANLASFTVGIRGRVRLAQKRLGLKVRFNESNPLSKLDAAAAELDRIRFLGKEKPETQTGAPGYVFPDW